MAGITIQAEEHLSIEVQERASDGSWVSKGVTNFNRGDVVKVDFTSGIRLLLADRKEPPAPTVDKLKGPGRSPKEEEK